VSAGSFFQTNRFQTDELVGIVTAGVSGRTAIDLYAGVGLFSVVLSREFERVVGVEASQQSHADLVYNSPANVKTVRSTVDQYLKNAAGRQRADLIVVDPPRGGLGEGVAKSLAALETSRLTYVSCDPATLARDLAPLLAGGYHIEEAHLVDLFPQTFHLESVLHLVR
jgi:23S rRNA (uracil1939-C5)-methyltransferase